MKSARVTRELIEEVARRCGVTALQVDEVIGYYSMLHRKPLGSIHVQVCTNIACQAVGGEELYRTRQPHVKLGHKQVIPDGQISLEEVECIGACSWAPAIQINYDFHHFVTPERFDRLNGRSEERRKRRRQYMRFNEPSPLEVKVVSARFDLENSTSIDTYLANDGYVAVKKALEMTPEAIIDLVESLEASWSRRCGFPDRHEMEFRPAHDR